MLTNFLTQLTDLTRLSHRIVQVHLLVQVVKTKICRKDIMMSHLNVRRRFVITPEDFHNNSIACINLNFFYPTIQLFIGPMEVENQLQLSFTIETFLTLNLSFSLPLSHPQMEIIQMPPGFVPHLSNLELIRQAGIFYPRITDLTGKQK